MTDSAADQPAPSRLVSLDAFRGLVILAMVFVNFLAGVHNIPAWAKHAPDAVDAYTFVDLVFPAFLFAAGVAIPLALFKRQQAGHQVVRTVGHIVMRAGSLLFLGVIFVNGEAFSAEATGMGRDLWYSLAMVCVIVIWSASPSGTSFTRPRWQLVAKILAMLALGFLLAIFRTKTDPGQAGWLRHSWWGILGLIGWAYLNCSLVYLATGGNTRQRSPILWWRLQYASCCFWVSTG